VVFAVAVVVVKSGDCFDCERGRRAPLVGERGNTYSTVEYLQASSSNAHSQSIKAP
jgi:hypothetical protein